MSQKITHFLRLRFSNLNLIQGSFLRETVKLKLTEIFVELPLNKKFEALKSGVIKNPGLSFNYSFSIGLK